MKKRDKPPCKSMSRRTETAYKAQSPGELAQHNKAQGLGDRVNAAVVWRKFTSLSGEICPTCGQDGYGSRTEDQVERSVIEPPNPKVILTALYRATCRVIGQKSAEAILAECPL